MIPFTKRLTVLETDRLTLNPVSEADAGAVFALMDEPEVMAYWEMAEIDDPDAVTEMVRGQVAEMASGRAMYWSIRTVDENAFVGCCELSEIDRKHKRADVGFMLGRGALAAGHALEAVRAVVAYAGASGLRKLSARTHLGERRSEALLETLGFKEGGLLRGQLVRDGERRDGRLFGLLL